MLGKEIDPSSDVEFYIDTGLYPLFLLLDIYALIGFKISEEQSLPSCTQNVQQMVKTLGAYLLRKCYSNITLKAIFM